MYSGSAHFKIILLTGIFLITLKAFSQDENIHLISKSALLEIGKIDVEVEDFDFDAEYTVISYVVSVVINGFNYEIKNKGAYFCEKTIRLITKLKRGQRIYFDQIKVRGPDGMIREIEPLILKID